MRGNWKLIEKAHVYSFVRDTALQCFIGREVQTEGEFRIAELQQPAFYRYNDTPAFYRYNDIPVMLSSENEASLGRFGLCLYVKTMAYPLNGFFT